MSGLFPVRSDLWSQGRIGTFFCGIALIFTYRTFAPMLNTHFPSAYMGFFVYKLSLELSMLVTFLFYFIIVLPLLLPEAFPVHMEFWRTNWHQSTSLLVLFSPFGIIPHMHLTHILHLALPLCNTCDLLCC